MFPCSDLLKSQHHSIKKQNMKSRTPTVHWFQKGCMTSIRFTCTEKASAKYSHNTIRPIGSRKMQCMKGLTPEIAKEHAMKRWNEKQQAPWYILILLLTANLILTKSETELGGPFCLNKCWQIFLGPQDNVHRGLITTLFTWSISSKWDIVVCSKERHSVWG